MAYNWRRICTVLSLLALLSVGGYLRASGLFRGLERAVVFHPDTPKQVMQLHHYLHGKYVQYYDSLFYDGYPYGLNRVDEGVLRILFAVLRPIQYGLNPEQDAWEVPSRSELYYWGRGLRVFYGLCAMILIYAAVRRLGGRRFHAWCAALLYAVVPLGAVVTHSVTGDVGVDLFLALAIWCVTRYATQERSYWLALSGVACGVAFACKFQGVFGLWFAGATVLLGLRARRLQAAALARAAGVTACGFLVGVLAAVPAFWIDPEKTWRNMWRNFAFVRDYGAPKEILALPLFQRVGFGLRHNLPLVLDSIGWGWSLLSLLAVISMFVAWHRRPSRLTSTGLAVALFPWVALLISAVLKPAVQPFHFSFLLPAMAVAVGIGWLPWMTKPTQPILRIAASLLLLVSLGELGLRSVREDFFWRRPETTAWSSDFSRIAFGETGYGVKQESGSRVVKSFFAEPSILPVFRNRPSGLQSDEASFWRGQHILPVPSVPWPTDAHWIFLNGPIFLRNDRMFVVPAGGPGLIERKESEETVPLVRPTGGGKGAWTHRTLVFPRKPTSLKVGLRTGRWPARYDLRVGGQRQRGFILPHRQVILTMDSLKAAYGSDSSCGVTLAMRAELGPVWVTLLDDLREEAVYTRFGPHPEEASALAWPTDLMADSDSLVASLSYMGGTAAFAVPEKSTRLPGDALPLAGGAYELRARVVNSGAPQKLRLEWKDETGWRNDIQPFDKVINPGLQEVVWHFSKWFAPYDGQICASAEREGLEILSWQVKPDVARLAQWPESIPASMKNEFTERLLDVDYPGIGVLAELDMPDMLKRGMPFAYRIRFDLDEDVHHKVFHEAVFFLHLKDAEGHMVATLDYPLRKACLASDQPVWQTAVLPTSGIEPGMYTLDGGLYNIRTRIRYSFLEPEGLWHDLRRNWFRLATVQVE